MTGTALAPPTPQLLASQILDWCAAHRWLAVAAVLAAAVAITMRMAWLRHCAAAAHNGARLLTIVAPPQVDPDGVHVFWASLHHILDVGWRHRWRHGRPHIAFEYRWTGRQLTINMWIPATVSAGHIQAAVRGSWPGAATTLAAATAPLPADALAAGGAIAPRLPAAYLLRTDHDSDPLRTLLAAAADLRTADAATVQILARPASRHSQRRLRASVAALRSGQPVPAFGPQTLLRWAVRILTDPLASAHATRTSPRGDTARLADPRRERDARAAVDKLAGPQWTVAIRYGAAVPGASQHRTPHRRSIALAEDIAAAFGVWTARNQLRSRPLRRPERVLAARPLRRGFLLGAHELAAIAALPLDLAVAGLTRSRAKPAPAPVELPTGGRGTKVLGRAELGGHPVAVPVADARQHFHLLGSTGSGKSTLMLNMIMDDVHAGRGTIVIDPKGDLVTDVLDRIPVRLARKVVLIDPDQPHGATLNPLQGDDHDLVVDNIVSIFSRIFAKHWGPRIDDVLRVACLTLLRKANATLTLIPPLLNDRQFRSHFTAELDDPEGLRGFWEWFESTPPPLRAQVIGPVLARLRAFLLRDFVRQTIGPPRSSFDMRHVLDGGILLARLPKGQLGEDTTRLMGSFVLASAWQAATQRIRIPEQQRPDSTTYIDECHNFLNLPGSVDDMLAEARGYHFGLVLAHQNLTQLPRETQQALSANARNKIYFSCAPEDAHQLARHTLPELDEHDLSHMDAHRAAARLVAGGKETPAFTLRTKPPTPALNEASALRQAVQPANAQGSTAIQQLSRSTSTRDTGRQTPTPRTAEAPSTNPPADSPRSSQ